MTEIIARRQFAPLYIWLAIGVLAQFGWEAGLLLGGIRSAGFASFGEKLRRRAHPLSFSARIAENNRERPGRARGAS